jgi:histidine kinase/DNA gyrase B/HSP90-like ATPase
MPQQVAQAAPSKAFFIDMFTRDIRLEDCLLDLVDNSVDAMLLEDRITVSDALLRRASSTRRPLRHVELTLSDDAVTVTDNCGGISITNARNSVFRLGNEDHSDGHLLSVYGVGLKRAMFKIGTETVVTARRKGEGFKVVVDLPKWSASSDWTFPLQAIPPASVSRTDGLTIAVRKLRPEAAARMRDPEFVDRLARMIGRTYALFLNQDISVSINGHPVAPRLPAMGELRGTPSRETFTTDGVKATLIATVSAPDPETQRWSDESAGWYVFCNGRLVVYADKTELTGWGEPYLQFHPKFNKFFGIAFFSGDPYALPWTTTKAGLNRESFVYLEAQRRMPLLARPVLSFLTRFYPPEVPETPPERSLAQQIKSADVRKALRGRRRSSFAVTMPAASSAERSISVQFAATVGEIDRAKRALARPRASAGAVGRRALDYFLERECS